MVEPVLHFLKIHRKMIFGNPAIIVQDMLRKAPKTFDAVDMIFAAIGKCFAVVQTVMLPQAFQRVVASKRVGVVDGTLPRFLPDNSHQFLGGDSFNHARIDLAITLQEPEYNVFSCRAPSALALPPAAEVALIHLDFTRQTFSLKFRNVVDRLSESLVHARNRLVIEAEIMRETIRRLLLIEPPYNGNFCSGTLQRFLFSTTFVTTSNVSATRLRNLERTAENTLFAPQKVGRAPENVLFPLCHMDIVVPYGYETP